MTDPPQTKGRGVLYIVWGDYDRAVLERSTESLKAYHPELPVHVETLPATATLLDKSSMMDMTPFEETLFLDIDTVVLDRLDFGFDKAGEFGIAAAICECPWARRYGGIDGDMVEYNTGVLFFTEKARPLFDAWKRIAPEIDSSLHFMIDGQLGRMPLNDQAGFAAAVEETGMQPFVLPHNWNFRPKWQKSWYGPLKVWHDYSAPPEALLRHNDEQKRPDVVLLSSSLTS